MDHVLDPISPEPLTPWQASQGFSASIQTVGSGRFGNVMSGRNDKYTIIIVDAGYFFIHGLYIDIPAPGIRDGPELDFTQGKVRRMST